MKKQLQILATVVVAVFVLHACTTSQQVKSGDSAKPESIILMISDGTGVSQITSLLYTTDNFQFERFKSVGLVSVHPLEKYITDSAAGATAFATGEKTRNGMISTLPNGDTPETILEKAEKMDKATGLVATSQLTHATPAAFAAHTESRGMEMEIARQMAEKDIEVLLGGGQKFFLNNDQSGDLVDDMKSDGYTYIDTRSALNSLNTGDTEKVVGLFSDSGMEAAQENRLPLELMTRKATEILANRDAGFFLMVEASQVDWEGHDNDGAGVVAEMEDMNGALKFMLDFQERNPETLVVWIADHETGGMAVGENDNGLEYLFASGGHTATLVTAFAKGPGEELFSGVYDNTDFGKKLISLLK